MSPCTPVRSVRPWLALSLLVILLTGCTSIPQRLSGPPAQTHTFALEGAPPAAATAGPVLLVAPPTARPGYESARMVYVQRPSELSFFSSNEWAAPPASMLEPLLVRALESAGRFSAVVAGPRNVLADLRLDTEILVLHQDFTIKPSRARVELRAQMVEVKTRRVLATRSFQAVEPAPSDDPYGGVTAVNRALTVILKDLAAFCAESVPAARPASSGR